MENWNHRIEISTLEPTSRRLGKEVRCALPQWFQVQTTVLREGICSGESERRPENVRHFTFDSPALTKNGRSVSMRETNELSRLKSRNWVTLRFVDTGDTFFFVEKRSPSAFDKISKVLSAFAAYALVAGALLIVALNVVFHEHDIIPFGHAAIGVCLLLVLFIVTTTGFNSEFGFDRATNEVWTCRRNKKSQARIKTHFEKKYLRNIAVHRLEHSENEAILTASFRSRIFTTTVLRGNMDDISAAHRVFCKELKIPDQPVSGRIMGKTIS